MQPTQGQDGGATDPQQQGFYHAPQSPTYIPAAPHAEQPQPAAVAVADTVSWEASEYIHRAKGPGWKLAFGVVSLILFAGAIWLQSWTFAALIIVLAIALGFIAFRQPRTLRYALSHSGLRVNDQLYDFTNFRAFSVRPEDAFYSVILVPVKRFMPAVSVYFAENDGEKIVDILGSHLPMEELEPDFFDNLMHRIHF